jgi:hypothetical protein
MLKAIWRDSTNKVYELKKVCDTDAVSNESKMVAMSRPTARPVMTGLNALLMTGLGILLSGVIEKIDRRSRIR